MEESLRKKIYITFSVFLLVIGVIISKAVKIQVFDRAKLISKSKNQILRERKIYPKRGNIYDRNGSPLAINIQTFSIFTIPKNVSNRTEYKKLAKIVPELSYSKISNIIKKRKRYTWLARKIRLKEDQVEKIKSLKGIYIESVPKRIYPNHELLSQALGFVGIDNKGLSGIEYGFDEELRGEPLVFKYVKDAKGRPIKFESQKMKTKAKDIHLTIDKDLQSMAEKYIKEAVVEHEAKRGGVGVIDVKTGEVLAIANYPSFDPNEYRKYKSKNRNLAFVTDPIEPGSTFKIFTIAAALDHNVLSPNTNYYCEQGRLEVEGHVIREAESKKKYEWLSTKEIVKHSSNVGTTKIAFDLKFPRLKEFLGSIHIGEKTGIELPAESRGIFTDKENVSPLSLSNISFGQGVATTGIQMLAAYGAIANDGVYVPPTIIKGKKNKGIRVLKSETAKQVTEMMLDTVDSGTGTNAKIPYFKIAGKTSTAQRPDKYGGYNGYVAGFAGFPVGINDQFAVYVYVDDPQKQYYGNTVAAPVFKKLTQYILYKRKEFAKDFKMAHGAERNLDRVEVQKYSKKRKYGRNKMPNLVGLDKKSVLRILEKNEIKINHFGIGVVESQFPEAGIELTGDTIVKLNYSAPKYE